MWPNRMFLVASTYLCMLLRHSNLLYSRCLLSLARTIQLGDRSDKHCRKCDQDIPSSDQHWDAVARLCRRCASARPLTIRLPAGQPCSLCEACFPPSVYLASDWIRQCTTYTVYTLPCQGALYKMLKDQEATTVPQTGCEELGELTPYVIQS